MWSKGLKHFSRRQNQMTFIVIGTLRVKTDGLENVHNCIFKNDVYLVLSFLGKTILQTIGSSLIRVHSVCFHDKNNLKCIWFLQQTWKADDSYSAKKDIGRIRVKN